MSLSALPLEIISEILDYVSNSDRLALCLVDKQLSQLVQPSLFKRLNFRNPVLTVKCVKLILAKPVLALGVRDVLVSFQDLPKAVFTMNFWRLFAEALCCMSNLISLHFSCINLSDTFFRKITFPRLKKFSSIVYVVPEVSRFLVRHPTITQLFMGGERSANVLEVHQDFLPSLKCFIGSVWVAEKVIPNRPVTDITLAWITFVDEARTMSIIKNFALSSAPIENFYCITLRIGENRISLLRAIARYLPHLRLLRLNNFGEAGFCDQLLVDNLVSLLPCFKHLECLIIPSATINTLPHDEYDRSLRHQEDEMTVQWKKKCPRLVHIIFPSCNIYDYDAPSMVWKRAQNPLAQTISIFEGVY